MLLSTNSGEQTQAINALVQLEHESTAQAFLDRLTNDGTQTANVNALFTGMQKLKDKSIVENVFGLVSKEHQSKALTLLLQLSSHSTPISENMVWERMTSDQKQAEEEREYDDQLLNRYLKFFPY